MYILKEFISKMKFDSTITLSSLFSLLPAIVALFGVWKTNKRLDDEADIRDQKEIFSQIQLTLERIEDLIKDSNVRSNWAVAYRLMGHIVDLNSELKASSIEKSFDLEKSYYQEIISSILHDVYGYKYFFGFPKEKSDELSDSDLFDKTYPAFSESYRCGERYEREEFIGRIEPKYLVFFMRFALFDDKAEMPAIKSPKEEFTLLSDMQESEEFLFKGNFPEVYAYIQVVEKLSKEPLKESSFKRAYSKPIT